jgi:hypothetical protein
MMRQTIRLLSRQSAGERMPSSATTVEPSIRCCDGARLDAGGAIDALQRHHDLGGKTMGVDADGAVGEVAPDGAPHLIVRAAPRQRLGLGRRGDELAPERMARRFQPSDTW